MPKKENEFNPAQVEEVLNEEEEIQKLLKSDLNYVEPFIKNEDDKRRFIGYLKPLYNELGVELTDEKIEQILNRKPPEDADIAADIQKLNYDHKKAILHNGYKDGDAKFVDFQRVYNGMLKPENSDENKKYNKELQEKAATEKGQIEIILEAAKIVADSNPDMISLDNSKSMRNYRENFRTFKLMFLSDNVGTALKDLVTKKKISADDPLIKKFEEKRVQAQTSGNIANYVNMMQHPLTPLIPEDFQMNTPLSLTIQTSVFWSDLNITMEDRNRIIKYMSMLINMHNMNKFHYFTVNGNSKNLPVVSDKFKNGEVVIGEDGKPMNGNANLLYGENYTVINRQGEFRCLHLELSDKGVENPKYVYSKAYIPNGYLKEAKETYQSAAKYLGVSEYLSKKLSGIMGKTLSVGPEFQKIAPNLEKIDYEIPAGISDEVGECLTFGALLTSEVAAKITDGSTLAGDTNKNKIVAVAVDWISVDDNRIKGADVQLNNIRSKMTNMLANPGSKEAKDAFARVAEVFGSVHMEAGAGFGDFSDKRTLDMEMCEKLEKVISENPGNIAEGVSVTARNQILMKANMSRIMKDGAKATVELFTNVNLSPEQKKECLKKITVANTIQKLAKKDYKFKNPVDLTSDVAANLGMDEDDISDYVRGNVIEVENNDLGGRYHYLHQNEFERALATEPEKLIESITKALPDEEIEKLAEKPSVTYAKAVDNLLADTDEIEIPKTDEISNDEAFENEKKAALASLTKRVRTAIRAEIEADDNKAIISDDPSTYCGELVQQMEEALDRTGAGIFGPSNEFKAVEKALEELKNVNDTNESAKELRTGMVSAHMKRVLFFGNKYLEKKHKAGVNEKTKGTAGERYRNMVKAMEIAERYIKITDAANERCCKSTRILENDIRTSRDFVKALELRESLINARKVIDDADPFFYRSSKRFKEIQSTLDSCIDSLKDYTGKVDLKLLDNTILIARLSSLEAITTSYLIANENPLSDIGADRYKAIKVLNCFVNGKSKEMEQRDNERHAAQNELKKQFEAEANAPKKAEEKPAEQKVAEQKAAEDNKEELQKQDQESARYDIKARSYNSINMTSKSYDEKHVVAGLVNRVRMNNEMLNDLVKTSRTHPERIPETRSMLADRVLVDMIARERELHKNEPVFEKAYISDPEKVKAQIFAPDTKISHLLDKLVLKNNDISYAQVFDRLDVAAIDNMERGREAINDRNAVKNAINNVVKKTEPEIVEPNSLQ